MEGRKNSKPNVGKLPWMFALGAAAVIGAGFWLASKYRQHDGKVPWMFAVGAAAAIGAAFWLASKYREAQPYNRRYRGPDEGQHARQAAVTTMSRVRPSRMPSAIPPSRRATVDAVNALFGVQLDEVSMAKVIKDEELALDGDAYLNRMAKRLRGGHQGAQDLIMNARLALVAQRLGITTHFLAPYCNGLQVPSAHSQGTAIEALLGLVLSQSTSEQADKVIHIMSEFLS